MQEAIALTWKTLQARLRNLRAGAIAGLGGFVILVAIGFYFRSGWMLAGLPAVLLAGFAFLLRDHRLVAAWEDSVLSSWGRSDLCMGILIQTLENHPHALKATLRAMAASLPTNPDFLVPPPGRILAHLCLFRARSALQETRMLRSAIRNVILACLPASLWYFSRAGRMEILLGLFPLALLPFADAGVIAAEWRLWRNRMAGVDVEALAAAPDFSARLEALPWSRAPSRWHAKMRARFAL